MPDKLKGRLMGLKFKTFSGAANRAAFERSFSQTHVFRVEDAQDAWDIQRGFRFRIRKTKREAQ